MDDDNTDASLIIDGAAIWELHATYGFPLELSIPWMQSGKPVFPTWEPMFLAAWRNGVRPDRLLVRLLPIIGDSYPAAIAETLRERLDLMPSYMRRKYPEGPNESV